MTGASFLAWRMRMGLSQREAEVKLGWSRASMVRHEAMPDKDVPVYIALACAAISAGLKPHP